MRAKQNQFYAFNYVLAIKFIYDVIGLYMMSLNA